MHLQRDYRPIIAEEISKHRRELGAASPIDFARVYLPHHFSKAMSRMHRELFADLAAMSTCRPRRLAVAAPRGHAKTTVVSLAYVLWCALYGREMHILLVSATKEQAAGLLKNIKLELQTNSLLLEDFPQICYPAGAKGAPKPWRDNHVVLRNHVALRALGAGQGIRGMKHGRHRPSLIILDDLETQEHVIMSEQRDKLRDWFEKTLLKAGDPLTNVIFVGTILHYDSLLACHVSPGSIANPHRVSGWQIRKYQAVEAWSVNLQLWEKWEAIYIGQDPYRDETGPPAAQAYFHANQEAMLEGSRALWPEMENYPQLMVTRVREGRQSFQSEKQNEPVDPKECIFREESFTYWDKDFASPIDIVNALGSNGRIYGSCDPSLGKRGGQGDFTAIIVVIADKRDKKIYVLVADIARRRPDAIIDKVLDYARAYKFKEFVVESNQFQEILIEQLKHRAHAASLSINVKPVNNTMHKQQRIESMEPLISQGILRFSIRQQLLLEQLRQFPMGTHDDGPDALHMAVERAQRPSYTVTMEPY